jgi:2-aminoethylphosphonate-pyruvate transaminase
VETKAGNLVSISKTRQDLGTEVKGELVGICKISLSLFSEMIRTAEQRFCHTRHVAYETDSLVAASQVMPISCPVVEDLVWCEIDDETHLARARNRIYPLVRELDLQDESKQ